MGTDKNLPKIKPSGVIQIRGKDVTTYDSKLDYAHQFGIKNLQVELLQYPTEQNGQTCICQAKLVTADDRVFSDIGDASPHNVPRGCADSFPRIASTRAKSRVLSDAFNIKSVVNDGKCPNNRYSGIGGDSQFAVRGYGIRYRPIVMILLCGKIICQNLPGDTIIT